ncbi:hypothetical protein HPB50_013358 [Hyalomma asiaticum]|uniref:Uncharacterized protein n=1 Tax=Hyalomma asiaticum TaxID=266040 RepID=A0ACB7RNV9_HYAAI|nr:hypothetical protein HPB50_013358 [Hyalomma asiaticum]
MAVPSVQPIAPWYAAEASKSGSHTLKCPEEQVLSCVPAARSPSKKYKQTIRRLQAKVAAQRKTIKRLLRQPHQAPSSTSKALGIIRPHVTEEVFKLLSAHVRLRPKGKGKRFPVSRATQVLSASVSIAITALVYAKVLPASAITTAQFCDRMDRIFDALNSSSKKKTSQKLRHAIVKEDSELIDFLRGQPPWIASWTFDGRRQPQTVIGWQITIQAICQLWDDLSKNYNFEYLLTRRLQQDPLENIFGHIRQKQGCNTNPNVAQFICGLKHICIRKLFKLSEYGNVEDDECDLLQELSPFSLATCPESSEETRASLSPRFPPCATEPSDESYVAPSADPEHVGGAAVLETAPAQLTCALVPVSPRVDRDVDLALDLDRVLGRFLDRDLDLASKLGDSWLLPRRCPRDARVGAAASLGIGRVGPAVPSEIFLVFLLRTSHHPASLVKSSRSISSPSTLTTIVAY